MTMEAIVNRYISEELVVDTDVLPLSNDVSLLDSNILDSMSLLNLVMFLEEQFGFTVKDTELGRANFETIDAICDYVRKKQRTGSLH
ncbi:MAG: acyl carrier protein [Ktedonobacterales bacterium]